MDCSLPGSSVHGIPRREFLFQGIFLTQGSNLHLLLCRRILYHWATWVIKQQRWLTTSATHLAQELLMNVQHSGSSRSFKKEMRDLKMRSVVAGHQKLTPNNWKTSSKLILVRLHGKLPTNTALTIPQFFSIWGKQERWQAFISGCLLR